MIRASCAASRPPRFRAPHERAHGPAPGASIGVHFHDHDEIYYVLEGEGDYVLDGVVQRVRAGDALLTRAGSTHSMRQAGAGDLVLLIAYPRAGPM